MKVGLIGSGSIGKRHYNNLLKHTADIVVFSQRKDLDVIESANTWGKFLDKGPYDVIFITNETYRHVPTIKKCLGLRPKAIFVEKPLSNNLKDLKSIFSAIKRKKVSLYVGYNFHFFAPYIYIKNVIHSPQFGKIYYIRASVGQDLRDWRARDYRLNYSSKRKQGGGVVLDLIHDINYPAWMLNQQLIPQAAVIKRLSDLEIDTEDCVESIFITNSGTIVSVHQDYLRIPLRTSLEVVGSKKSLLWDSISQTVTIQNKGSESHKKIITDRNDMFVSELDFFMKNVKSKNFFTNMDEAVWDLKIIHHLKKYERK